MNKETIENFLLNSLKNSNLVSEDL